MTSGLTRRSLLSGTASAMLAMPALISGARAASADVVLKLHHFLGPKTPSQVRMIEPWARRAEEAAEGRLRIEIYPSMTLGGSPPQLFRQAVDGVADIIWTVNGYTPGLFPRSEVFELPTIFTNQIAATNLAMRDLFDSHLAAEYSDVHVLFLHVHGGQALQMAKVPVRRPEDLRGLKLRVPGPTGNAVVEALGAVPVTMPVPDLPQALATNAVDGALIPFEIIPGLQLQETTRYQIEGPDATRFGTTTFQMSMNKRRWESLPEDIRAALSKASDESWLKETAAVWRGSEENGIALAVASGNEHIVLTPEEMAAFDAVLAPVVDQWAENRSREGFDAGALVVEARAAIAARSG